MKDVLDKWEAPRPDAALDRRVWASYRRMKFRRWIWAPVGIAAVLTFLFATARSSPNEIEIDSAIISTESAITVETRLDVRGFQPVRDAKLVREVK